MSEDANGAAILRPARPDECAILTRLALRSKAHWGYSAEFIEACRAELTVSEDDVADPQHHYEVAELDGEVVGFSALNRLSPDEFELDALFVAPEVIRRGIGSQLIRSAIDSARNEGARDVLIQGDPNAEAFYLASGARLVGERESSSIPGRLLPLFRIAVALRQES